MSYFERIQNPSSPELVGLYDAIVDAGLGDGEAPYNWFTSMAQRPDLLATVWPFVKGLLFGGELPETVKQMIVVAISAQADCRYCEVTHSGALQMMGVSDEVIASCAADPELVHLPSPHRDIVRFAVNAALTPQQVSPQDLQVLRDLGLREGEIMEATMLAAFTNFINTWADAANVPLDRTP